MGAREIEEKLASLYGAVDWAAATGLLQVAAIGARSWAAIAIGEAAPASGTDRFVLGAARARADALLATGAILRAEPEERHRYAEEAEGQAAFTQWRRERLGRSDPPALILLSRTGDFPLDHPAIVEATSGFVWTTPLGRERLGPRLGSLEVVVAEHGVVRAFRDRFGDDATLSIEAGPTTAGLFYAGGEPEGEPHLDELLLSQFHGELSAAAVGPPFVGRDVIEAVFPDPPMETRVEEPSGAWSFLRYR